MRKTNHRPTPAGLSSGGRPVMLGSARRCTQAEFFTGAIESNMILRDRVG